MWIRFQVWRVRRKARYLSRQSGQIVRAKYGNVKVGVYENGRRLS